MALKNFLIEAFTGIFDKGAKEEVQVYKDNEHIVSKDEDDGSIEVTPAGLFGQFLDVDNRVKSDEEYITMVRNLSTEPDFDYALQEIANELIIIDEDEQPIKIDLDEVDLPDKIKKKIIAEFDNVIKLLNFTSRGYDIIRQWYVDGRLYYHVIIDDKNPKKGILELRNVDPRKIKKIKEIEKAKENLGVDVIKKEKTWYVFTSRGQNKDATTGIKIHPDRIVYIHSGLKNPRTNMVVSHMHKAIKRFNQLRLLEESVIIYRFSRAPERRVFYVGTAGMPPKKAEKYVHDIMMRFKNKIVYDASSGEVSQTKKYMSLLEDYFLPRNTNGDGTEIKTLSGSQLSNGMEDVENFRRQFYLALNVPISRLDPKDGFSLGRASEISREEVKFARFCTRLRVRFSDLFDEILQKQLFLKNIVREEDWKEIRQKVKYKYNIDNHFKELLDQEVLASRLRILQDIESFTPRAFHDASFPLFSVEWVRKHVLMQSEFEIEDIRKECDAEMKVIEELKVIQQGLNVDQQGNLLPQPEADQQQIQNPQQTQTQ